MLTMNSKKSFFGFFFGLILIAIPIFNLLHFILVDHQETIDLKKKEVIHHQCNHYTFHSIFIDTHDEPIIVIVEEYYYNKENNSYLKNNEKSSTINYCFTRGPPDNFLFILSTNT